MIATKHPANPVLDIAPDAFDRSCTYEPMVLLDGSLFRMWYGGRDGVNRDEICYAESADGVHWTRPVANPVVTCHDEPSGWDYAMVTRPSVLRVGDLYHQWYSSVEAPPGPDLLADAVSGAEDGEGARLGHATSPDGIHWAKDPANPVLSPAEAWERLSIQCPSVLHEDGLFRLWYSGGRRYEPDAVGYAESPDGVHWTKHPANPIFTGNGGWEGRRIGAFSVRRVEHPDGSVWHYAFYNAMDDTDKGDGCGTSRVGLARSRDGITNWERHPANPVIDLGAPGAWDSHSVYKPSPLLIDGGTRWRIWYNAARQGDRRETIGLAETDVVW
jgi:predicted GH43/DUF377 family glycosyl hydrolase